MRKNGNGKEENEKCKGKRTEKAEDELLSTKGTIVYELLLTEDRCYLY